jgi:hypothetical protein
VAVNINLGVSGAHDITSEYCISFFILSAVTLVLNIVLIIVMKVYILKYDLDYKRSVYKEGEQYDD